MSEPEKFMLDYAPVYESYDPAGVATFINIPCIFCLGGEVVLLDSTPRAVEHMGTGLQNYEANGCVRLVTRLHGERQKGYDLLSPLHDWFTEGFETRDLKISIRCLTISVEVRDVALLLR